MFIYLAGKAINFTKKPSSDVLFVPDFLEKKQKKTCLITVVVD